MLKDLCSTENHSIYQAVSWSIEMDTRGNTPLALGGGTDGEGCIIGPEQLADASVQKMDGCVCHRPIIALNTLNVTTGSKQENKWSPQGTEKPSINYNILQQSARTITLTLHLFICMFHVLLCFSCRKLPKRPSLATGTLRTDFAPSSLLSFLQDLQASQASLVASLASHLPRPS